MQKAIYKITNQVNGKSYIGQSVNPYHRFVSHKSRARNHDFRSSQALYHAILKYGEENFKILATAVGIRYTMSIVRTIGDYK